MQHQRYIPARLRVCSTDSARGVLNPHGLITFLQISVLDLAQYHESYLWDGSAIGGGHLRIEIGLKL